MAKLNTAKVRASIEAERSTIKGLRTLINSITELVGLDEERMSKRIDAALQSEYGRVNGLVNLLAAVVHWPAEAGDGPSVSENRKLIEERLGLDLLLLADIRQLRGYHTFHTDDLTIIDGIEPSYDEYEAYVQVLLEDLKLQPQARIVIDPITWQKAEARAKVQAVESIAQLRDAVERHKQLMAELAE